MKNSLLGLGRTAWTPRIKAVLAGVTIISVVNFFASLEQLTYLTHPIYSDLAFLYFCCHLVFLALASIWFVFDIRSEQGVVRLIGKTFFNLPIPTGPKAVLLIVGTGNALAILFCVTIYPFADVGMFRSASSFRDKPSIVYSPKYYFMDNGSPKIIDIRKQHVPILKDLLSWRHNNEFTFSAAYHYRNSERNFEFLMQELRPLGIDEIWLGAHKVDYKTGEVSFETGIHRSVEINSTANVPYGPVYVPPNQKHQVRKND